MKGIEKNTMHERDKAENKDVLEELFQHATTRERPPAEDEQAIREALHGEWQALASRRRRRNMLFTLAAAASVVLAVFAGSILLRSAPPSMPILQLASVEKVQGNVYIHPTDSGTAKRAELALSLESGQQIVTGLDSRLALQWTDGTSLRVDQNSELRFTTAGEISLVAGRVYVDTELAGTSTLSPVILTPAGPVSHLGTRYMTRVSGNTTIVSVRQGLVVLGQPGVQILASGGEQVNLADSGLINRRAIEVYGDEWQWAQDLAPGFESNGRAVSDFLDWVGRESGRSINYASLAAEQIADSTLLRGNVDLEPTQALTVMLQTTDLVAHIDAGSILVVLRK